MKQQTLQHIAETYGISAIHVLPPEKGYRSQVFPLTTANGERLSLIIYKHEGSVLARIRNAHYVGDFLADAGLPARRRHDKRILRLGAAGIVRYAGLYIYLPGQTIPWEGYTMEHLKALGGAMSDMHALLGPLAQEDLPPVVSENGALLSRMQSYFSDPNVQRALAPKLNLRAPNLSFNFKSYEQLPAQPLHMDFVRGNILFNDTAEITGILDFEKAAWGPPVFDIARTLAFLLVDCKYKEEAKIRKYFLHSGYNKRGRASFNDWAAMEELVDFFLIHDLYKFLRHNPYESLPQNEHFVRTRDLLLKRNILMRAKVLK